MMATNANVTAGMYGDDNGHEFRVVAERQSEVRVEYVEDGRRVWFLRTRFERDADSNRLHLI
jgi:hypothetical protein